MFSLRKCREILGPNCPLTDSELELLRDQMTALADVALEAGRQRLRGGTTSVFDVALTLLPDEQREEIVERAAIIEIDGGLQRAEAEEAAVSNWARAHKGGTHEQIH